MMNKITFTFFLCLFTSVAIFYHFLGIPPHFVKADNYSANRTVYYINSCYPTLSIIDKNFITEEEMQVYQDLKNNLGGDISKFELSLYDRYRKEYYVSSHKNEPKNNIVCRTIEEDLQYLNEYLIR